MLKISETRDIIFPEGRPKKLTFCLREKAVTTTAPYFPAKQITYQP